MKFRFTIRKLLLAMTLAAVAIYEPSRKAQAIYIALRESRFDPSLEYLPYGARVAVQTHNSSKQIRPTSSAGLTARLEPWDFNDCLRMQRRITLRPTGAWIRDASDGSTIPTGALVPKIVLKATLFGTSRIE